jgi:hypothetical protein
MQAAFARPVAVSTRRWVCWGHALTPRIGAAPEDDGAFLVGRIAQDLVQLDSEAVEVANVQGAKVAVEGVVEQRLVDAEVDGRLGLGGRGCGGGMARGALRGRLALLRVGKGRVCVGRVRVRGEVETVLDVLEGLNGARARGGGWGAHLDDLAVAGGAGAFARGAGDSYGGRHGYAGGVGSGLGREGAVCSVQQAATRRRAGRRGGSGSSAGAVAKWVVESRRAAGSALTGAKNSSNDVVCRVGLEDNVARRMFTSERQAARPRTTTRTAPLPVTPRQPPHQNNNNTHMQHDRQHYHQLQLASSPARPALRPMPASSCFVCCRCPSLWTLPARI